MISKKYTCMAFTRTGPIAKIDGVWYSVNGDATVGIVDVRHQLTQSELELFDVQNDSK